VASFISSSRTGPVCPILHVDGTDWQEHQAQFSSLGLWILPFPLHRSEVKQPHPTKFSSCTITSRAQFCLISGAPLKGNFDMHRLRQTDKETKVPPWQALSGATPTKAFVPLSSFSLDRTRLSRFGACLNRQSPHHQHGPAVHERAKYTHLALWRWDQTSMKLSAASD
jgi:hypothetical protein